MNKNIEILGLIPARGGSTGLPGKNIKPLLGIPLIAHTILAAQMSKYITRIVVATDSDEIATEARKYGAEVPFKRPAGISKKNSHFFEILKYSVEWLKKHENYKPEIVCSMLCTTPLRTSEDIDKCMQKMLKTDCDWVFTVNEIEYHPWRTMVVNGDRMKPLFDIEHKKLWANRQELPELYRFNGGVIAGKRKHIESHSEYNIDNIKFSDTDVRCVIIPSKRSLDIDTLDDFNRVENVMKNMKI